MFEAILITRCGCATCTWADFGYDWELLAGARSRNASRVRQMVGRERLGHTCIAPSGARSRMIAERQPIHTPWTVGITGGRKGNPLTVAQIDLNGIPFLPFSAHAEGRALGRRDHRPPGDEVRAFTAKQIDFISTFASQA